MRDRTGFPHNPAGSEEIPPPSPDPAVPHRLRILVVDDDELVRCTMEFQLEELGAEAVIVSSGEEALAKLQDGLEPDLVLLDINMPGLGGPESLPRLRALQPGLPVFLATGCVSQAALDLVKAYPGTEILLKPFTLEELRNRLKAIPGGLTRISLPPDSGDKQ